MNVWRKIVAAIRGEHYVIKNPSVAEIQPGDMVIAVFGDAPDDAPPAGWTAVTEAPGLFCRRWTSHDV